VKLRVERDVLADSVAWAARTLPSRPSLPVLAGLVLTAGSDGLTISSFDYEVSGRVEIDADVSDEGVALVSGRLLADIARALPAAPVVLESEGSRLSITCGRSSFVLPTLPAEDYPQLPSMPTTSGTIGGRSFADAVAQVAIAAGRDDTLPTLTGVRLEIEGTAITLAATDRYRLAVRDFTWQPQSPSITTHALIPARTLADTAKSLADVDEVLIALASGGSGEGLIGFEGDRRRTTTRLLDGEFPKYRTLLPTESSAIATVDTTVLSDAVKRVALVAERNTPVRLAFEGSELTLRAGAGDDATAVEVLECTIDGDAIDIAFNPSYLLDGLAAINAGTTQFAFTQSTRPAVLTAGVEAANGADSYKYLLMPVRLTG
jgi:DNA polymerase-3 subunit beta